MKRISSSVLVGLVVLGLTAPSLLLPDLAYGRSTKKNVRKRAKKMFKKGELAYQLGEFKKALKHYGTAYSLLPLPGFLFNIGQCHRMLGNYKRALFFYKGYRRRVTMPAQQSLATSMIKLTRRQYAEKLRRERQEKARSDAEKRRRAEIERRKLALQALRLKARTVVPPRRNLHLVVKPRRVPVTKRWWFWTAIVGGVAAIVGASLGATLGTRPRTVLPQGTLPTADRR